MLLVLRIVEGWIVAAPTKQARTPFRRHEFLVVGDGDDRRPSRSSSSPLHQLHMSVGPPRKKYRDENNFDDGYFEEECTDEEECELDWDAMPDEPEEELQNTDKARTNLEMMWGLSEAAEDCDIDHPDTCGSEPCEDCSGRGVRSCRFCQGSGKLGFMRQKYEEEETPSIPSFMACPICEDGVEVCSSCRGTGWVAGWTTLGQPHHSSPI